MTSKTPETPETCKAGRAVILGVILLLEAAAHRGLNLLATDPPPGLDESFALSDLGLGAPLAASQARALLAADIEPVDVEPVDLERGGSRPDCGEPLELVRAAESLTRTVPIEALPAGSSRVVVALCDLLSRPRMMLALEGRSIGELLLDCDLIVREVLMDTADGRPGHDPDLGRGCRSRRRPVAHVPRIVPKRRPIRAQGCWPCPEGAAPDDERRPDEAGRRRQWPGPCPADDRLLTVCENDTTAAELLLRRRTDVRPMRPKVAADLEAAKARLMHVLYVGAHGVQVDLNRDLRDLPVLPAAKRSALPAESIKRTVEVRDRMAAFEQLAGSYVCGTFPAALHGEHKPLPELDRLREAPAGWDIQAHRALVGATTAATMMLIAQTQAHTAFASQTLLRAAAETGSIEAGQYRTRLAPALESGQASWVALATTWAQLAPQSGRRLDPDLVIAANEIRAAMLEIIHERTGVASVESLAATVDLKQVSQILQLGLTTSTDLAYALREATADLHLLASPRGVNAMAMVLEAHGPYGNVSTEAWVRPVDHAQDRPVTLPEIVRDSLTQAADQVIHAVTRAPEPPPPSAPPTAYWRREPRPGNPIRQRAAIASLLPSRPEHQAAHALTNGHQRHSLSSGEGRGRRLTTVAAGPTGGRRSGSSTTVPMFALNRPGDRSQQGQGARRVSASPSWATVGEPAIPSGVASSRQANAGLAPGCANGSAPSSRMVGEPVNPTRAAAASDVTARVLTSTGTRERSEAVSTRSTAIRQLGHPSKHSTVTFTLTISSSPLRAISGMRRPRPAIRHPARWQQDRRAMAEWGQPLPADGGTPPAVATLPEGVPPSPRLTVHRSSPRRSRGPAHRYPGRGSGASDRTRTSSLARPRDPRGPRRRR